MKKAAMIALMVMFVAVSATAGTIGVPHFNDEAVATGADLFPTATGKATFLALKNNTASTQEYTILYYGLTGGNRTPSPNTFSIGANSTRGWRPIQSDPNEGTVGQATPDMTAPQVGDLGSPTAGNATILYTGTSADVSGRVLGFITGTTAATNSAYAYALVP